MASIQIPTTGAEVEGTLVLTTGVDHPMAGGHSCFPAVATGFPASGYGLTNHTPGYSADGLSGLEI